MMRNFCKTSLQLLVQFFSIVYALCLKVKQSLTANHARLSCKDGGFWDNIFNLFERAVVKPTILQFEWYTCFKRDLTHPVIVI